MILVCLLSCATLQHSVVRDAPTYTVEILATLQRQEDAADALRDAASYARENGDVERCILYAEPALMIDAYARSQAYRALWLADLPYPNPDGSLPEPGEEQPDPGPSAALEPVTVLCPDEDEVLIEDPIEQPTPDEESPDVP